MTSRVFATSVLLAGLGLHGAATAADLRIAEERLDSRDLRSSAAATVAEQPRARLSLERWRSDQRLTAGDIEITDLDGRDLSAEVQQHVADGQLQLSLPDERSFIVRPKDVVSLRLPQQRTVLPGGVVQSSGQDRATAWLRPTIMATPLPVTWNAERRRYSTRVLLGLEPPAGAPDTELDQPVVMRLGFRGITAEPLEPVSLAQAGVAHEREVSLDFLPTTETPVLELRSTLGSVDLAMDVLPRLELRPVGDAVPGFGLGTVAVDVVRLHPHGTPAVVDQDTDVSLEISGGARPVEDRVVIPGGGFRARFELRSGNLGPATITALAGGLSDTRTVRQYLPVAPLIAALLGGAVGGYGRRFSRKAADVWSGARIVEGTLMALVAYAASVLGVGWLQIPAAVAATAAGAFLVGALAGFVGVTVIESLTRRLQPAAE